MNSGEQQSMKTTADDYKRLEIGFEQVQIKLKEEAISDLPFCPLVELPEKGRISGRADNGSITSFDFDSCLAQNGFLDVTKKDFPVPSACSLPPSRTGCLDVPNRPDRPMTLSRPCQLPSCCNFKGQHWRLYVQGEFSCSSLPRHFKDADKELDSSYKNDLENIIRDLKKKEKLLECNSIAGPSNLNRGRSEAGGEHHSTTVPEAKSTAATTKRALIPVMRSKCSGDHKASCEHSNPSQGAKNSDRNEDLISLEKSSVFAQNRGLMEDINKNCADIKNQLAILESFSGMIDRAQNLISLPLETGTKSSEIAVPLATGLCKLSQENSFVFGNKSFNETKASSASFRKADRTNSAIVFRAPPPPPPSSQESLLKSDISSSSSSFSSPCKKLKSRKSRNHSLQRCGDDRLAASERRSRTLSPSITERLDYRVSRATQTCDNSAIFDRVPHVTPNAEVQNGKMECHDEISSRGESPDAKVEQNGDQSCVQLCANLLKNGKSGSFHVKHCHEGLKVSPFFSQDRKSTIKGSLSFSFHVKSREKKQLLLKQDSTCSAEATRPSAVPCSNLSEAELCCLNSESLLDKMHKNLYPYQYNRQNRKRSTEAALSLNLRKNLGPSNSFPRPATLPHTKPSLPPLKLHHCVSANSGCSSHPDVPNSNGTPVVSVDVSAVEDTLSGDMASPSSGDMESPSSGYSETTPASLKENSTSSPCYSKRLCYQKALSPEQLTTSGSTPSPSKCVLSSLKTIKEECSTCPLTGKNSKDILQLQAAEKKLVEACEWLICAGFPQYVQLYREGQFPLALTSVEADHEFLDPNCLLILLQQITLLNRLMSMKIRLPLTSGTRDWYTGEMLFAVSPVWNYDSNYHWWVQSDRAYVANWTKSYSLLINHNSLEHSRSNEILKEGLEADGHSSIIPEVQDEASVHLTSGYESETSPMSTFSLGRHKLSPHLSSCSSGQPTLQSRNPIDHTVSDCGNLKQNALNDNRVGDWGGFLGSSQETVRLASTGSQSSSLSNQTIVQEDHTHKNIPDNDRARITCVGFDDTSGIGTRAINQSPISPGKAPSCCPGNSSKFGNSSINDSFISRDAGNTLKMANGMSRKSFYDNALSVDPQTELDLILAELYHNIGSLDETLNKIDVDEGKYDRLQSLTGLTVDELSEDTDKLSVDVLESENANRNEMEIPETSCINVQDQNKLENFENSKLFPFYQSKKALLSIEDLVLLQKLCILKLTSLFEMHCASSKPEIVCSLRFCSSKSVHYEQELAGRIIFGVPPVVLLQKMGVPLPPVVTLAMEHLKAVACDSIGLFRKPGVQSRIQQLQKEIENNPGFRNFDSVDAYDLADVLKRYFRELPGTLLPKQTSQLLMKIFTDLPSEFFLEAVQAVMLLLSDVSRQVLHRLLQFLAAVAEHSEENQMNASNLAVCFLPSFFHTQGLSSSAAQVIDAKLSRQNSQVTGASDRRSTSPVWDHKIAVTCISFLINNASSAFQIPDFSLAMLHASRSLSESLSAVGVVTDFRSVNIPSFIQNAMDIFNFKDFEWISCTSNYKQTKLSWHVVDDDRLLPMWCCTTAIEAPPGEVLARLKGEQHLWDGNLVKGRIVERLSEKSDIFHFVLHVDNHEAPREFCELRTWKCDSDRGSYVLAKTSVFHPNVPLRETLRAITLVSHYLIEPCGAGKSCVVHLSRIDIRGHLLDWYYNVYGRLLERHLLKLNKAFTPVTENTTGPETNL